MKDNIILDKSFDFAVRVVKLYKFLCDEKKEYILSKQLLRSGTSIGANINEAQAGHAGALRLNPTVQRGPSKADFIAKMSISSKEARESKYWIELLIKTEYLNIHDIHVQSIQNDVVEIIKLLTSIIKSSQGK